MFRYFFSLLTFCLLFTFLACDNNGGDDEIDDLTAEEVEVGLDQQVEEADELLALAHSSRTLRAAARTYIDRIEDQDPEVLSMAREIFAVQQTAQEELAQLTAARRINLPADLLGDSGTDEIEEMMNEDGPQNFAESFYGIVAEEHENIAEALDEIDRSESAEDLRQFVVTMRAYLSQHQPMIDRLEEMVD